MHKNQSLKMHGLIFIKYAQRNLARCHQASGALNSVTLSGSQICGNTDLDPGEPGNLTFLLKWIHSKTKTKNRHGVSNSSYFKKSRYLEDWFSIIVKENIL